MELTFLEADYHICGYDAKNNLPHNDRCVEILQMWSTGGYFVVKNHIFPIEAGHVFLINAVETHYSNPQDTDGYKRSKIIISSEYFEKLMRTLGLSEYMQRFLTDNGGYQFEFPPSQQKTMEIDAYFADAAQRFKSGQTDKLMHTALTLDMLHILMLLFSAEAKPECMPQMPESQSPKSVALLCDYINRNLDSYENISMEKICDTLHISPSYASHLFKKITNMSIVRYATELRISEAKKLLLNTDMKVVDIAERLRFHNCTVFCKTFKKIVHCTPSEYRCSRGKHRVHGDS